MVTVTSCLSSISPSSLSPSSRSYPPSCFPSSAWTVRTYTPRPGSTAPKHGSSSRCARVDSPEAGPGAGRLGKLLLSGAQLGQLGLVQFDDLTPWSAGKCSCFSRSQSNSSSQKLGIFGRIVVLMTSYYWVINEFGKVNTSCLSN